VDVVDEDGEPPSAVLRDRVGHGGHVRAHGRCLDEDQPIAVLGEPALGFLQQFVVVDSNAQGQRAGGDVAELRPEVAESSTVRAAFGDRQLAELAGEQPRQQRGSIVFVGDVDGRHAAPRHRTRPLQAGHGLAHARFAAHQQQVARTGASVEHLVERHEPSGRGSGREAQRLMVTHLGQRGER
jgi:hypothetical protein